MASYDTGMKTILLFMIAVNVGLYIITASQVLPVNFSDPDNPDSPVTDPNSISSMLISVDLSTGNLAIAGTTLIMGIIISKILGNLILGVTVSISLFVFTLISPLISWVLFGLPRFLNILGTPAYISAGVMALLAVPIFFTVISFLSQRPVEGHG